jgi:hypothetical protein
MVVRNATAAGVAALVKSGFNAGTWKGAGIFSSTAAADHTGATSVGMIDNGIFGFTSFRGIIGLTSSDVLVRYTYAGDADLNGKVTMDDFSLFLNGYQAGGTGWALGDFDYNGVVNLDDFSLFLAGYQNQGAPLTSLEDVIEAMPLSAAERSAMLAEVAAAAVPEPAGVATLGLLALGLCRGRARWRCPKDRGAHTLS